MKNLFRCILSLLSVAMLSGAVAAEKISLDLKSSYVETMNPKGLTKNVVKDYGMSSHDTKDQSALLQKAIADISKKGGGCLIIPKGTYCFSNVYMHSNVHILVDKDAVLKPFKNAKGGAGIMLNFSSPNENKGSDYVENVSIRGLDGEYTVDYSIFDFDISVRFVANRMVKNFYIADAKIMDNQTKHCGIIFVPSQVPGADKWEISRPTNGEVRNCSIFNSRGGYGLCQFHGAQSIYLENIYSQGGVTLRLESGAGGPYAGVFDIQARNVVTEDGGLGVMVNPHCTHNGTFKVDGVLSKGSGQAVGLHKGFIDSKNRYNPDATIGTYANDSEIVNVKAIYGTKAQVGAHSIWIMEPDDAKYALYKPVSYDGQGFTGPSVGAVTDETEGTYTVTCRNVVGEGFGYEINDVLYVDDIKDRKKAKWEIRNSLPCVVAKEGNYAGGTKKVRSKAETQAAEAARLEKYKQKQAKLLGIDPEDVEVVDHKKMK